MTEKPMIGIQSKGLKQNQPQITPPTEGTPRTMANLIAGGGGANVGPEASLQDVQNDYMRKAKALHPELFPSTPQPGHAAPIPDFSHSAPGDRPLLPVTGQQQQGAVKEGMAFQPPQQSPNNGMNDYLSGVKSREQRQVNDTMQAMNADLAKRGIATSGLGATISGRVMNDANQRMQENVSQAAFDQWKTQQSNDLAKYGIDTQASTSRYSTDKGSANIQAQIAAQGQQQAAHDAATIKGQQDLASQQAALDLQHQKDMIPLQQQQYQSGVDSWMKNFGPGSMYAQQQQLQAQQAANQSRPGSSPLPAMPNIGGGSSPDQAIGGAASMGDDFGKPQHLLGDDGKKPVNSPASGNMSIPHGDTSNPLNPNFTGVGWGVGAPPGVSSAGVSGISSAGASSPSAGYHPPSYTPSYQPPPASTPANNSAYDPLGYNTSA